MLWRLWRQWWRRRRLPLMTDANQLALSLGHSFSRLQAVESYLQSSKPGLPVNIKFLLEVSHSHKQSSTQPPSSTFSLPLPPQCTQPTRPTIHLTHLFFLQPPNHPPTPTPQGQEEIGSPNLAAFLRARKDLFDDVDVALSADGGQVGETQPGISTGFRCVCLGVFWGGRGWGDDLRVGHRISRRVTLSPLHPCVMYAGARSRCRST
jgi:hypothetical protein